MKIKFLKKNVWIFWGIIFVSAFFRMVGINWALPYTPHPDEWNMAASISQLSFADKLNPHFFAYGQFPIYLSYFTAKIYNWIPWINLQKINTSEAIFFLRFWSVIAGIGTVYLVYLISRKLLTENYSLLAAILAAFVPGLIQSSHFGTTESLLSFFFLGIIYLSLKTLEEPSKKNYLLSGLFFGLALGTKITALVFVSPIFLVTLYWLFKEKNKFRTVFSFLVTLAFSLVIVIISSPYLLLNHTETQRILSYEASIATGETLVFYTRQFFNTIPIIFQFEKIFPYTLGWPTFIMGSLGVLLISFTLIRKIIKKELSQITSYYLLITFVSFLTYFSSQAFLFTKWTRFMTPVFAFFPIFAIYFLSHLKNLRCLKFLLVGVSIIPGIIFSSIYFRPDIRFAVSEWIYKNIPSNSKVLSETGNVVDIPVRPPGSDLSLLNYHLSPTSFNFYDLDENPKLFPELLSNLEKSDYIFIPSKRLFANMLRLPDKFPLAAKYYSLLFSGELGFSEVKKFQSLPDERAEETWTVFDHPVIRIYKKTINQTRQDYEKLFQNI